MTELQIRLFGGLHIAQAETPLTDFISNKVPALLAYLAVEPRPHSRDTLATLFWGDLPDADAKNNLRQALSNLRKLLEAHLNISRDSVEFNTAQPYVLDVAQFDRLIRDNTPLQTAAQAEQLRCAAALYHGDFLAGFQVRDALEFDDWAIAQRIHWRELALHTLHTLSTWYLQHNQFDLAGEAATHLLRLDPWHEESHRHLMLALARSGQIAAALQQYDLCRRTLQEAFGTEPAPPTHTLYERIRAAASGSPSSPSPLPTPMTPFIGRVGELSDLHQRLSDPTCRLLTLVGPGGMGKTRLALELAAAYQPLCLNGVRFIPLAGVNPATPDALRFALVDALALKLAGSLPLPQQLINHLAHKEMLLVLDNLEHLLEQSEWLNELLQQAPLIKILATSQERLNLSGEWVVELDGLPQSEAEQLFISLARRAQNDFALTEENAAAIQHICQLVDGLPLGLELASAWVHVLPCADIAQEIATNLDFLTSTRRNMPTRQRSLRAVFDHSWQLLTPPEQTAFASLSVFRGSFSREAAHGVTGITIPTLASLVDKSLLRRQANGRYELHERLRQYADQQLSLSARQPLQNRHAQYFLNWLHKETEHLNGPQETATFRALITDHANIRAAWDWAVQERDLPLLEKGLHLLRVFYNEQGRYREGMAWLEKTAQMLEEVIAQEPDNLPARQMLGQVQGRLAGFYLWGGMRPRCEPLFLSALETARQFADPGELGLTLLNYGYYTVLGGDYPNAKTQFRASLDYYRRAEDSGGVADALSALGAVGNITGELVEARQYLEESVAIGREMRDEHSLRTSLVNLGNVFYLQADYEQAKIYYEEVLPLCQKAEDRSAEAITLCNLSSIAYQAKAYDEAERLMLAGAKTFLEINSLQFYLQAQATLASIHTAMGEYEQARAELQWALNKALTEPIPHIVPQVLYETGCLYLALGRTTEAMVLLYWVLANEMSLAEHRQEAQKRLAEAEADLPAGQITALKEQAKTVEARTVLGQLTRDKNSLTPIPTNPPLHDTTPLPHTPISRRESNPPQLVSSRFEVGDLLARGGMGEVYRGRDTQTNQPVAIKRLLPHLIVPGSEMITRFKREAEVLRQLNHPNIVKLLDTVGEGENLMIVMEYVAGGSLRDWLDKTPLLPLPQVLTIALELADALARTHHRHIVHRDLKPANVLIAPDGSPRLTDFGIARLAQGHTHLTTQGATLGTVAYMSPEALKGEDLDARTDVWSFGVMVIEMLCGRNPFDKLHFAPTLAAILQDPLPDVVQARPGLPPALAELLQTLLVRDRSERQGSMRAVAAALEQISV